MRNPRLSNIVIGICVSILALIAVFVIGGIALEALQEPRENTEGLGKPQRKLDETGNLVLS